MKKKIALICGTAPHRDPRVLYEAQVLSQKYDVDIISILLSWKEHKEFKKKHASKIYQDHTVVFLRESIRFWTIIHEITLFVLNFLPQFKKTVIHTIKKLSPYIVYQQRIKKIALEKKDFFKNYDLFYGSDFNVYAAIVALAQHFEKKVVTDHKEIHYNQGGEDLKLFTLVKEKEHHFLQQMDGIFTVSPSIQKFYAEMYPELKDKLWILPNSMPYAGFTFAEKESLRKDDILRLIVSAGYSEGRGIEELIHLWRLLDPQNVRLDIRLSGLEDYQKKNLQQLAGNSHNKTLFISPPVPEDDMVVSLRGYDVGIIPYLPDFSLNHQYCCPNKFAQYLNAGLAILTTPTDFIAPFVRKHKVGVIYNPADLQHALCILKTLFQEKEKLKEMQKNALWVAEHEFNWNQHSQVLLDVCEKLMKSP